MKRDVKVISGLSLFLALSLASCESAKVSVEEAEKIDPPALVECRDEVACDRDPEHMESFVANFYRWNEANNIVFFSFPRELSAEVRWKHLHARIENKFMREILTSEFYHWTTIYTSDPEPDPGPQYCPPGTNAITCSQDASDEWLNATARLVEIKEDRALVIVSLPFSPGGDHSFVLHLSVRLKVEHGAWRIDSICCPETVSLPSAY